MPSMPSVEPFVYVDDEGRSDAERYFMGCLDDTYVVGRRVKKLAEKMLPRIRDGYKQWHFDIDAATRPVRFIEKFCRIPSAKNMGKPFVMAPYERVVVETAFGFIDDDGAREFREVLVEWARKSGKALSLDTEIPTPDGWKLMRDIHPGDYVFGQDGKPSMVIVESEVFDKPMYLVTFEDGSTIKASADHIWTVQSKNSKRAVRRKPRITDVDGPHHRAGKHIGGGKRYRDDGWYEATTGEIAENYFHVRADGKGIEYFYRVPMNMPVEYPKAELPIDPYVFGAWLGDGTSSKPQISIGSDDEIEMVHNLSSRGHQITPTNYPSLRCPLYDIDHHARDGKSGPFKQKLIDLDVLNNKHIPDAYLQSSTDQRWELLCGLMDTDGTCDKGSGLCEFTQKNELLAKQVVELCASLGIKASIHSKHATCNGVPAGIVWRVTFLTDKAHSCFHLKRKHEHLKERLAPRMSCKSIVNIEAIPNEPSKCIAIDNDSHLYLAGRQYTATHNTSLLAALNIYMLTSDGEGGAEVYNGATSESQARLCYGATNSMIEMSPQLKKRIRRGMVQKRGISGLNYDKTLSYLCTISSNSKKLDGLNTSFAVLDELAACEDGGATYDLLTESMSSRKSPMLFIISTENYVRENIWDERKKYAYGWLDDKIEDDTFLPFLYELDSRDEVWDERMWPKASPGLGITKDWDYLRNRVSKAQQSPARMPSLLTKEFNLPSNSYASFLSYEECVNRETYTFDATEFRYGIVGFDLADRGDLNAAVMMCMKPDDDHIYERAMFWIAEDQVEINSNSFKERDGVPYHQWAADGWIRIVPGNKVNQMVVIEWLRELVDEGVYPFAVGYDKWHVDDHTELELQRLVGETRARPVEQYAKVISPLMKEHRLDLRAKRIIDNDNPVLEWCRSNVNARADNNDNYFPQKKGLRPQNRIDGYMAELCAYGALKRNEEEYMQAIGW